MLWVVHSFQVIARPSDAINARMNTGEIEVKGKKLYLLNQAVDLPFPVLFGYATKLYCSTTENSPKTKFYPNIDISLSGIPNIKTRFVFALSFSIPSVFLSTPITSPKSKLLSSLDPPPKYGFP